MEKFYKISLLGFVIKMLIPFSISMYIERGDTDSFPRNITSPGLAETCDEDFCHCEAFSETFIYNNESQSWKCVNNDEFRLQLIMQ